MITEEIENMLNPGTTSHHSQVPQNCGTDCVLFSLFQFDTIAVASYYEIFLFSFSLCFTFRIRHRIYIFYADILPSFISSSSAP